MALNWEPTGQLPPEFNFLGNYVRIQIRNKLNFSSTKPLGLSSNEKAFSLYIHSYSERQKANMDIDHTGHAKICISQ